MIKEIDWKDITEGNKIDINETNIRQAVVTGDEFSVPKLIGKNIDIKTNFGESFLSTANYGYHSFAEIFPDSTDVEFDNLLEDIKQHGQYDPIIIFEGKIADGRTRKKVQDKLQRPTLAHEWLGEPEDLLNYLYAKSQHRHLTSQQRAVIALQFVEVERELAKQRKGMRTDLQHIVNAIRANEKQKAKGRALDHVAKKMSTNRTYIGHAEYVQSHAKELLDYVKRNELSLVNGRLLAQKLVKEEDRKIAFQKYQQGEGKMQAIIDDILLSNDPTYESSRINKLDSNIKRKIIFNMRISKTALEDIKDVLYRHGYSEKPYQILVACNDKKATEWIETIIGNDNVSTTTYEVVPESNVLPIDL